MALVKFNKEFKNKETNEIVEANQEVDITLKRADEIVENIQKQNKKFPEYKDFGYERVKKDEANGTKD